MLQTRDEQDIQQIIDQILEKEKKKKLLQETEDNTSEVSVQITQKGIVQSIFQDS